MQQKRVVLYPFPEQTVQILHLLILVFLAHPIKYENLDTHSILCFCRSSLLLKTLIFLASDYGDCIVYLINFFILQAESVPSLFPQISDL